MREGSANFIGGKLVTGTSGRFGDVFDPSTGEVQARVPLASAEEVQQRGRQRGEGPAGVGGHEPAAPRAGSC